jgi:hypothetical protein
VCNAFIIAAQIFRNRCTIDLQLLRNQFLIAAESHLNRCGIALQSLRNASKAHRDAFAIAAQSIPNRGRNCIAIATERCVLCVVCSVLCAVRCALCAMCCVLCFLCCVLCAVCIVVCAVFFAVRFVLCNLHRGVFCRVLRITFCVLCAVCFALCAVCCALCAFSYVSSLSSLFLVAYLLRSVFFPSCSDLLFRFIAPCIVFYHLLRSFSCIPNSTFCHSYSPR